MILQYPLDIRHEVTELVSWTRINRDCDDTCAVLTLDGRRGKSLLDTSQFGETYSLALRGIDDHVLYIL